MPGNRLNNVADHAKKKKTPCLYSPRKNSNAAEKKKGHKSPPLKAVTGKPLGVKQLDAGGPSGERKSVLFETAREGERNLASEA